MTPSQEEVWLQAAGGTKVSFGTAGESIYFLLSEQCGGWSPTLLAAGSCSDFPLLSDSDISILGIAVQGGDTVINSISLRLLLLLLVLFCFGFLFFALVLTCLLKVRWGEGGLDVVASLAAGILSRVAKWNPFVFR